MFIIVGVYSFVSMIVDGVGAGIGFILEAVSTPFILFFSWMVQQSSVSETSATRWAWGLLAFCVLIVLAGLVLKHGIMAVVVVGIVIPFSVMFIKFCLTVFIFILFGKVIARLWKNLTMKQARVTK